MVKNCYKLSNLMHLDFEHYITKYFRYKYTVFMAEILLLADYWQFFTIN